MTSGVAERACTKCSKVLPATPNFFYRQKNGRNGLMARCKTCTDAINRERTKNADPQVLRDQSKRRSKKYYQKNIETIREKNRLLSMKYRKDPVKNEIIKARKRGNGAGLTPEELRLMLERQENKCAICCSPNPTDLDHCHKTGIVRFLLCKHCNRGLGAFKDNPELLRKAADMLERIYGNK